MPDFIGTVEHADLERSQVDSGGADEPMAIGAAGGPDSPMLVGPATFELSDGTRIKVPERTPGGNMCEVLGWRESPYDLACVVLGGRDEQGSVGWFAVEEVTRARSSAVLLSVERFEGRSAVLRVGPVLIARPIRDDARLTCRERGGDLTSTPVRVPSPGSVAELNDEFEITRIECIFPTD